MLLIIIKNLKNMKQQKQPKLNFRNTRSRIFFKKESQQQQPSGNAEENTGVFWKEKGNQAFRYGKYDTAIENYTKAIEKNPSQSIFFFNRAKCYQKKGNYKQALLDAEQACELDDQNVKAHYLCGCILAQLSKHDSTKISKAQNRLKKALRLSNSLKKQQFSDHISIKLYRLRKLVFLLQREQQKKNTQIQLKNIEKLKNKNIYFEKQLQFMKKTFQQKLKQLNKKVDLPDHLCCKITLELMEDPVTTQLGHTYERSAVEDHFQTNGYIQPINRTPISGKLYPNLALKKARDEFLDQNPWGFQFSINENYIQIQF